MKILFITEGRYWGKVTRDNVGRTDMNWIFSLDADHTNAEYFQPNGLYDIGIYIVPKISPILNLEFLERIRTVCKKVGILQESDQIYWQRYSVPDQIQWLHFVSEVDFILCHNENDVKYYSGLFPNKKVNVLPTLMLDYNLKKDRITRKEDRSGCMLGGTWCDWYSGQDSYIISQEFGCHVFAPSMGRKDEYEDYIEDIQYLPYSNWETWMYELSKRKYAVHLMRTHAAGSFQLNCAYLKIPCIGWEGINTQEILFPKLTFKQGDMEQARQAAKHLHTNQLFYDHVVEYAYKQYMDVFHIEKFNDTMNQFFQEI